MKKITLLLSFIFLGVLLYSQDREYVYYKAKYDSVSRQHLKMVYEFSKSYLDTVSNKKIVLLPSKLSLDEIHTYSIPAFTLSESIKDYQCGDNLLDYIIFNNDSTSQYYIVYANNTVYHHYWTLKKFDETSEDINKLKTEKLPTKVFNIYLESVLLYDDELFLYGGNTKQFYELLKHPENFYFEVNALGLFMVDKTGNLYIFNDKITGSFTFVKAQEYFDKKFGQQGVLALVNNESIYKKFKPCKSKKDRITPKISVIVM